MTLTEVLSEFVYHLKYEDLEEVDVDFTKLCILDWYGSALAGSSEPPVQALKDLLEEWGGNPQASLVTGGKSSVGNAVLVNGAASHVVELDDIHKSSIIHAGTVVIPAALAIAEAHQLSGKEMITAIAAGYEVCYRIGEAVSPSHYYYFHNTATCGTFGAAAAVAKLLKLNPVQMAHALGNAGSQAAGLWEFIEDGAMTKQLHTAKAAYNGTMAAVLAQKSFTGASRILEGRRGFFEAMAEQADAQKITEGLGQQLKIRENSFKIHASCRHTHPSVDCVLKIKNAHEFQVEEIRSIKVKTYKTVLEITDKPVVNSIYSSKFSTQFCAALAMYKGSASLSDFNEETLRSQIIKKLMAKVEVKEDAYYEAAYPEKWGASVEVKLQNGISYSAHTDFPKGDPEQPADKDELVKKFMELTGDKLVDPLGEASLILKLEEINVPDWISRTISTENIGTAQ
ncbi:MmgE/PrpD family protein [Fictibacillus enclensis]|uniref:MmgE/PrpD family protein n=1 Tax=Fictibacillus enclensis TaxID=1017270 RepID=UPI0025A14721|nr:MmgE/PrpD family protein [Fictibacillus enclensis]MDM5200581.1 MmgE/PrpD family protein [Fictibacillus enclensis]